MQHIMDFPKFGEDLIHSGVNSSSIWHIKESLEVLDYILQYRSTGMLMTHLKKSKNGSFWVNYTAGFGMCTEVLDYILQYRSTGMLMTHLKKRRMDHPGVNSSILWHIKHGFEAFIR